MLGRKVRKGALGLIFVAAAVLTWIVLWSLFYSRVAQ